MKRLIAASLVAMCVLVIGPTAQQQPPARQRYPLPTARDDQRIAHARSLIGDLIRQKELPGFSAAVARDGIVVWSEGFGLADVENRVPVTPQTRFRLGSVSKMLTTAGLAKLVESGKVNLDAPVQQYVPTFPKKPWPVTTRQLASHTAGIRHYVATDYTGPLKGAPHFANLRAALAIFENDPLLFEPGTKYSYSSYGWNLISAVMQGAAGEDFLAYMQRAVFDPLGLRSTGPDHVDAIVPNRTRFYAREAAGRPLENAPYVDNSYKWAGGGFLSTAEDLVRFGSAHLQPGFFQQSTLDLMFTRRSTIPPDNTVGVGLGWRIGTDPRGGRILFHSGSIEGGRSVLMIFPESRVVVAILANIGSDFGDADAQRVGAIFIDSAR